VRPNYQYGVKSMVKETNEASNPAIVVTGASSGIGRAISRVAARDKCFLLLVGRSRQALDDLVAELAADGAQAAALSIDLLDPHAADCIENALSDRGLYCDVLVNSAGFGVFGPAAKAAPSEQLGLLDVNIRALTELTLRFLPGMVARGRGGVLNVGSITGYAVGPNMAVYYASKAYVNSFSAAIASEVAGSGVTVTCLTPGVVRTPFFARCSVGQTRLVKLMPRSNAADIAEAGWRGFKTGKCIVIPKFMDRIAVTICMLLPRSVISQFVGTLQAVRQKRRHTGA
jgi:short-subunit dehydrogenase